MKRLVSLAAVVAFFVATPQCFGQDACLSPAQLVEEQQLVQMSLLQKGPPEGKGPGCIQCCGKKRDIAINACKEEPRESRKACRETARDNYQLCSFGCHHEGSCDFPGQD